LYVKVHLFFFRRSRIADTGQTVVRSIWTWCWTRRGRTDILSN